MNHDVLDQAGEGACIISAGLPDEKAKNRQLVFQIWKPMRWDDVRYFVAVGRSGSLTTAAALTRTSPQTVARRVETLEAMVGGALFVRSQAGYAMTDLGRRLLPQAEAIEEACAEFGAQAAERGAEVAGTVRLATTENLANELLMPPLRALLIRHPGLRLELITGPRTVGLSRREADLALRLVRPERGNLVVQKLGKMAYGVYASPGYLRQVPLPPGTEAADAAPRQYIVWDDGLSHLPAARWLEHRNAGRVPALATSSLASQRAAAMARVGMALLPCFLAARVPALQRLDADGILSEDLWLAVHANLATSHKVRAVAQVVRSTVTAAQHVLSGREQFPRQLARHRTTSLQPASAGE